MVDWYSKELGLGGENRIASKKAQTKETKQEAILTSQSQALEDLGKN